MHFEPEAIQNAIMESTAHKKKSKFYVQGGAEVGTIAALIGMPDGRGDGGDGGGGDSGAASGGGGGDAPAEGGEPMKEGGQLEADLDQQLVEATTHDPRKVCFFRFLRFIQKTIRVFYVSFFFYFAPFGMLLYQFYLNMAARHK